MSYGERWLKASSANTVAYNDTTGKKIGIEPGPIRVYRLSVHVTTAFAGGTSGNTIYTFSSADGSVLGTIAVPYNAALDSIYTADVNVEADKTAQGYITVAVTTQVSGETAGQVRAAVFYR
ncbi:MAG: hypothetical protein ACP5JP_09515 [bacterium]